MTLEYSKDLFSADGQTSPIYLEMPDGDVQFYEHFFDRAESDLLFATLLTSINWTQERINLYGRITDLPRLTAWYGNHGSTYTYSGIPMQPNAWTPELLGIKSRIDDVAHVSFNSVLLNLYRSGKDGVAWHSDNEKELGKEPVIGSVSFGETRAFQLRHKARKELQRLELPLTSGSLLIMKGPTQHHWEHQVPKTQREVGSRINLTFRVIR